MTSRPDDDHDLRLPTPRDLAAPLFRYWRGAVLVGSIVLLGVTSVVLMTPKQYQAEMKFLVKRERVDPVVSADPNATAQLRTDVTEDDLNSEVELLKSRDLLQRVAAASGLLGGQPRSGQAGALDAATAAIVQRLESGLKIAPIKDTTFIDVTYRAPDPRLAARVLSNLSTLYIDKHRELHRPAGAYDFYTAQVERYRKELADARARLNQYDTQQHLVSPDLQQQSTLQRLSEFDAELQQARAKITESDQTSADLQAQLAATPDRETTQIRTSKNADLTRDLKSRILTLESQRSDMLAKFKPSYPPLREIENQLEQARSALAATEQAPLTEQTTDRNPTYQFLREELARVKTERAAASARASALERSLVTLREQARQLDEHGAAEDELKRAVKSAQDNVDLYQRKQEEARIADALDRTRIANVAVAEPPTVPLLPANTGRKWLILFGGILAVALGASTAYLLAFISPYFNRPEEIERVLHIPVLATFAAGQATPVVTAASARAALPQLGARAPALEHSPGTPAYSILAPAAAERAVACAPQVAPAGSPESDLALLVQRIFRSRETKRRVGVVAFACVGVREGPAPLCAQVAGELASHTSQSVCAVDADFRTPQLNSAFAVPEARGLSDALLGDTSGVAGLATQVSEAMWLLPAGFGGTAALPYLASESFHEQILQLRAAFEYVLVEAPPADEHGHAVAVAGATDGVVLVIDARATRREVARRVVGRLQTSGVPVLGAVLTNRTYPIPEVLYRLL